LRGSDEGFARGAAATTEGAGGHKHGGDHPGTGNRSDDGDLYARAPGDAEVAPGGEAGGIVEDRR